MIITSSDNAKLKQIRKLTGRRREREHAGRFVAEGEDLLAAAETAGWTAAEIYVTPGTAHAGHSAAGTVEVQPALLASVSTLGSGTRALGVYRERWLEQPAGPLCVALYGIRDPGNLGTILRSAEAFGAACVAIGPECADPFSPKAVRASMGAIFTVPLVKATSVAALPGTAVALVPDGGTPLDELPPSALPPEGELTLLIGAERAGLPEPVIQAAGAVAHIPAMNHSLNAAMAATVALYEVTRMARA